jgi:hypothetical protein
MLGAMARSFPCPYLGADVALTDEREAHIVERHPDLLPDHMNLIGVTLADPLAVYRGRTVDALVFSRWYDSLYGGKHLLVFVVCHMEPARNWT